MLKDGRLPRLPAFYGQLHVLTPEITRSTRRKFMTRYTGYLEDKQVSSCLLPDYSGISQRSPAWTEGERYLYKSFTKVELLPFNETCGSTMQGGSTAPGLGVGAVVVIIILHRFWFIMKSLVWGQAARTDRNIPSVAFTASEKLVSEPYGGYGSCRVWAG